jgi:regulator of protease activity HflC (stomatin/prohibitin superfamily)
MDAVVATNYALWTISILFLLLAILTVYKGVQVVPQRQVFLVERFGKYQRTLQAGLNLVIPFLDKVAFKEDILERQLDQQIISVITQDNVEIKLKTIIFLRIVDASKAFYRIRNYSSAIENAATSIVRSTGGELQLDEIQTSREKLNETIKSELAKAAEIWGIEITRTEIVDVVVDESTRKAQRKQLDAERDKRKTIAEAEADKRSQELIAEAELYAAQKKAEGIRAIAEAEAYQTEIIAKAILNKGEPAINFEILKRQIEGLSQIASSGNTKTLIIPTEITGILGSLKTIMEGIDLSGEKLK